MQGKLENLSFPDKIDFFKIVQIVTHVMDSM